MQTFFALTRRNIKLYFKDKGMFFSSLITPLILLVLYATFLAKVYRDSFSGAIPQDFHVENLSGLIDGMVGAMLLSSLLAVCCVTVAFCSNLVMVQDKYTGVRKDLLVTPVKRVFFRFRILRELISTRLSYALSPARRDSFILR